MPDLSPGVVLGDRFEIAGVLGRGGMATVYLARDRVRGSQVALKILHAHLADQPTARDRLRREIEAAARIRHPAALVASELFELDGQLALSLPLHGGDTLAEDVAERGPLPADALWRLGQDLSGALAEAHRAGVLHRDLAPGNVMMDGERRGVLMDFGLARLDDLASRTATAAVGTAGFTAPEILEGGRPTASGDLYGLGAVLYLAATGRAPFAAPSTLATLKRQGDGAFTPIAELRPDLPAPLAQAIEGLLAPEPARRAESARALHDAFSRREAPRTPAAPSPPPPRAEGRQLPARPELPRGKAALVVRERGNQRHRRQRLRRGVAREQAGLEGLVVGIAEKVEVAVRAAAGLPAGRTPEQLLTDAVATEAGLPADALSPPRVLMERQFRLVDGVSPEVAERLAEVAWGLGFRAQVVTGGPGAPRGVIAASLSVFVLMLAAAIGAVVLGPGELLLLPALITVLTLGGLLFAGARAAGARSPGLDRLPLAFSTDLTPQLSQAYTVSTTPTESPPPRAAAAPPTLASRTAERLGALEQAISASAGRLPAPAVLDLTETLSQLRQRARTIELEIQRVTADLAAQDPRQEEEAAARVSARLERLRARRNAGAPTPEDEIASLERALDAHRARLHAADADEQRLVQLEAALLEIGSAADRCRRGIVEDPEPARSVENLLGQLQRDQTRAAEAIDEVTRRKRAAAAAGMKQF